MVAITNFNVNGDNRIEAMYIEETGTVKIIRYVRKNGIWTIYEHITLPKDEAMFVINFLKDKL